MFSYRSLQAAETSVFQTITPVIICELTSQSIIADVTDEIIYAKSVSMKAFMSPYGT